jgi:FkbM family methyltransferase
MIEASDRSPGASPAASGERPRGALARRYVRRRLAGLFTWVDGRLHRLESRLRTAPYVSAVEVIGTGDSARWVRTLDLFGRSYRLAGVDGDDHYLPGLGEHGSERSFDWVCSNLVPADGVVLDVGANIGVTTLIAAGRFPKRRVYAIEAGPHVYARLAENLAHNLGPLVHAHHFAVGAEAGSVTFSELSAYGHVALRDDQSDRGCDVTVAMRSLDEFVESEQIPSVDLVKIDVEGYERNVLDGYINAEKRDNPLFYVEFNSWALSAFGRINPLEFLEYVIDRFAEVRYFDGADLVRLDTASKYAFLHRNLVQHGCVDDILFTNDPAKLSSARTS